ncbi:unnamed protein product [Sympodiomycopsis kandeliae]
MGLALWLTPSDPANASILSKQIELLSAKFQAFQASVPFPPHVTLTSSLQQDGGSAVDETWNFILETLRSWNQQNVCEIPSSGMIAPLCDMVTRGSFYQCVLILVEKVPALLALNRLIREALGQDLKKKYEPHISLLYSEMTTIEAAACIESIKTDGLASVDPWFTLHGLHQITLDTLELWDCSGPVNAWIKLRSTKLHAALQ